MKYVDLSKLVPPPGWQEKAQAAMEEVRSASDLDRSAIINRNSKVWQELKDQLATLSNDKCWYCELTQIRSDNCVDHFRPKNSVADDVDHDGYWWLAFRIENYRYSCTHCNSRRKDNLSGKAGGKQDRFPLVDESKRARSENDLISDELPKLLDPTILGDPKLLYFEIDGRVEPAQDKATDPIAFDRAKVSIELYNLEFYRLKRRRRKLYGDIRLLIGDGDKYFQGGPIDERVQHARGRIQQEIRKLREEEIELWAVAQSYLSRFKDPLSRPWLEELVQGI